ncbi:MAG: response regulator [Zhongshania sp.]|nr:response regulator [Zhongshania sp.]
MKDLFTGLKINHHTETGKTQPNARYRLYYDKMKCLHLLVWIVSVISIITIGAYIDKVNNHTYKISSRDQADKELQIIAARLEGNILGNLQTSKAMLSAIYSNPNIDQEGFAKFAKPLFDGSAQLRNISATRNLTLQYMYPVEGNESAIGFDYNKRPDQLKDLLRARDTQQTIISGPFELIQGGQGLIARIPVVITNAEDQSASVWGTVSAVIDLQRLYEASGLLAINSELNIAIRKLGSDSSAVFFGKTSSFVEDARPVTAEISMPSGEKWQLAAIPKSGWPTLANNASALRTYLVIAGLAIFSMIAAILQLVVRRQRHNFLLHSLFDLSPNGIALSDFESGEFLQVNDTLLASTGYSREEFIALNDWQLSAKNAEEAEQYQIRALQKTGRYGPYERNYIHKDGSEFPVRLSGLLIHDDSGKAFVWSIIEDISAQKKTAEIMQRQQSLMRSMGAQARVGAWEYIVKADKMYWSEMTRKIFKVADDFTPSYENNNDFYHTRDSRLRINKAIKEAMEDGVPFSEEIKIRAANGRETWVHITGQAEFHDQSCIRVYGSVQDIDSRRKVRDELIDAKEKAEAAVHAKSEFLAVMSHEIRTPMNGVLGMLNLLENSPLNKDQERKINVAKTSAQSLLNLINDILDFSKVDAGKLQLENIVFNIRKLFDDIGASQALNAHEKGLELIIDQSAINQSWVSGDPARLRQIVTNLLANAIKFTAQGNIILRAGLRSKNDKLILSCAITDTGIGIPNSEIKRLFSPFTQIDASTTRKFGGSGLGLSICKNLCELMGGSISVASTYHEGSTFTFTACLQDCSDRDTVDQSHLDTRNRAVFILDDNKAFSSSICNQLKKWKVAVSAPESANDLILQVETETKDDAEKLVIIGMTDENQSDTVALCTKLRQNPHFDCATIVIVAYTDIADGEQLSRAGANGFYLKPMSHGDLTSILKLRSHEKAFPTTATKRKLSNFDASDTNAISRTHPKQEAFSQHKVLLVEDNPVNQEVGRCTLSEMGFNTDVAANGQVALEMLNAAPNDMPYALILLDCQMPEMDGYQVCKHIRSGSAGDDYRSIPIIALTANAMSGDKEKCISAGMNDYLPKPFTPSILIEKLQRWLPADALAPSLALPTSLPQVDTANGSCEEGAIWIKERALDTAMGRQDVLKKLLTLFCEQISAQLKELDSAYAESNYNEMVSIAHAVKGSAAQLHGIKLQECAAKLERAAKDQNSTAVDQLYNDFKQQSESLKRCFLNYLAPKHTAATSTELS